ncbi:MAG: twin-arginine translocase TatA/TatE family subunit [Flavobacterium sp.]|nr:twin-arginine translocase TatA/TatE family subunit [Flavobacteriaceae bacterium]PHS65851.1 MAG: twin-arginine translocase TatA/TatE family subunit [Flavobacterium sp.]
MISITIPLFISGAEIFFIIFIVVMVFGADKVPEIARGLGKGMRQIKDATNDIKGEIIKSADKQGIDLNAAEKFKNDFTKDITNNIGGEINKVKDTIDEITGPIKRKF